MAELSTLARPYAKAAFEHAVAENELATWSTQLVVLANVSQADKVKQVLSSPSITSASQAQQIIALCGEELSAKVANFVTVLAENKRLALLPFISTLFEEFKANRERTVEVTLTSAFDVDAALEQKLAKALGAKLERDVVVVTQIDKSLIGGAIIRAADVVIDGSVRGRVAKLAEAMNS